MPDVRPAAVAGLFYPDDPDRLRSVLHRLLTGDEAPHPRAKALIVPHAGYPFSGSVAAALYRRLTPWAEQIRRVVLLGPSHRVPLEGMAVPSVSAFMTPLGAIELDAAGIELALSLPEVRINDRAHAAEHSLEVQLPFVQTLLPDARLVPIVVGQVSAVSVSAVIDHLWGGDETLMIISSDLSHYHDLAEARRRDADTAARIRHLDADLSGDQACGCYAINGLLTSCRRRHLKVEQVALATSADTRGSPDRVVGYGAFAFS